MRLVLSQLLSETIKVAEVLEALEKALLSITHEAGAAYAQSTPAERKRAAVTLGLYKQLKEVQASLLLLLKEGPIE